MYGNQASGLNAMNALNRGLAQQGSASSAMGQMTGVPVAAPPTLVSAIKSADHLNEKLSELCKRAYELAQSIGGPFPVSGDAKDHPRPEAAIGALNDSLSTAHRRIDDIQQALDSMARSLGA